MIKILVASRGQADLYDAAAIGEAVTLVRSFTNPDAHVHERDLVSDSAGRVYNRMGGVHQSYGQRHELRDQATEKFARSVAESVAPEVHPELCAGLLLIGSLRLINRLRDALPAPARAKVRGVIAKNLAHLAPIELQRHICQAKRAGELG